MFTTVWEYDVAPELSGRFEAAYGPEGPWVDLFRSGAGYLETVLLRDTTRPTRFVTLDRWTSRAAYEEFRVLFAAAYAALDADMGDLTLAERHLGSFYG
ncbi:MAG TPA: antibiotic biosynthesis monooxygenase [Gemmatimonadales bacterium]|nr:antibiotic biosynthesis monooxygenase [Gemmatimonadales bacterium]